MYAMGIPKLQSIILVANYSKQIKNDQMCMKKLTYFPTQNVIMHYHAQINNIPYNIMKPNRKSYDFLQDSKNIQKLYELFFSDTEFYLSGQISEQDIHILNQKVNLQQYLFKMMSNNPETSQQPSMRMRIKTSPGLLPGNETLVKSIKKFLKQKQSEINIDSSNKFCSPRNYQPQIDKTHIERLYESINLLASEIKEMRKQNIHRVQQSKNEPINFLVNEIKQIKKQTKNWRQSANNKDESINFLVNQIKQIREQNIKWGQQSKKRNIEKEKKEKQNYQIGLFDFPASFQSFDPRYIDLKIQVPTLPQKNNPEREYKIQEALGLASKQIFSIAFGLLYKQGLDESRIKIFVSEKLLYWILKLIKSNGITENEINIINQTLRKKILPYNKAKFPESEEKGENKMLNKLIIERKNLEQNQCDMIWKTQSEFQYEPSGNYNSKIMSFINKIIQTTNKVDNYEDLYQDKVGQTNKENVSLYKQFEKDISDLFSRIQDPALLMEMGNFDPRRNKKIKQSVQWKDLDQKKKAKHQEKVKSYSYSLINKKISENFKEYSEQDTLEGNFLLSDPTIFRIVTKWCEQLGKCFQKGSISQRERPFRMKDGSQQFIDKDKMDLLEKLLQIQKKPIDEFLKNINDHRNQHQKLFGGQDLKKNLSLYSEQQANVGQFSAVMFKNCQDYLLGYLSILIHQINCAQNLFQVLLKSKQYLPDNISQQRVLNLKRMNSRISKKQKQTNVTSADIPQLITFKIGDLFRSKLSSNQAQIEAIYKQLEKISASKPQILRILRVKNKLKQGTKDILINLMYRQSLIVQIQLAVKTQQTKFLQKSIAFSHYLYELIRAEFGPIHEMCNIWASKDPRYQFYLEQFQRNNVRFKNYQKKVQNCITNPQYLPFKCAECGYYYTGFTNQQKHIQYKNDDQKFSICVICQLQNAQQSEKTLQLQALNKLQNWEIKFIQKKEGEKFELENFPTIGAMINLKEKQKKLVLYRIIQKVNKIFVIGKRQNENEYFLIKQFDYQNFEKLNCQLQKMLTEHIIIKCQEGICNNQQINHKYFVPQYLKESINSQKYSMMLAGEKLSSQFFESYLKKLSFVTRINLSSNKLSNLKQLSEIFPHAQILVLNDNKFDKVTSEIVTFKNLQRLQLNKNPISQVLIENTQEKLFNLKYLTFLQNERLQKMTENLFDYMPDLQTFMISKTKLESLPSFKKIKSLKKVSIIQNQYLKQITDLSESQNLEKLQINNCDNLKSLPTIINAEVLVFENLASLKVIPKQIGELTSLKYLSIKCNQLTLEQFQLKNKNLEKLKISLGISKCLFKQINQLASLKKLYIKNNDNIVALPDLSNMKQLKKLKISSNENLEELHQSVGQLENLKVLSLFYNENLTKIPQFSKKSKLQCLLIKDSRYLSSLAQLKNLTTLKQLKISITPIKQMPDLTKNQSLQKLQIYMNSQLQSIPQFFNNLKHLEELKIRYNQKLKKIPQSIQSLCRLKLFIIEGNHSIKSVPKLKKAKFLEEMIIAENDSLEALPAIDNAQQLKKLIIAKNKSLRTMPALNNVPELKKLQIASNDLIEQLPDLRNAKQMIQLSIKANKNLKIIHSSIEKLLSLKYLQIKDNDSLLKIPEQIQNLCSLARLQIFQPRLPIPKSIEEKIKKSTQMTLMIKILEGIKDKDISNNLFQDIFAKEPTESKLLNRTRQSQTKHKK